MGEIDDEKIKNDYDNPIQKAIKSGVISTDDWIQQDKFFPSDGEVGDFFGWSVAIDGDYGLCTKKATCTKNMVSAQKSSS